MYDINIILSDKSGGVLTVSNSLHNAFVDSGFKSQLFNIKQQKGNMLQRMIGSIRYIKQNIAKDETLVLMHYDAIFIGVFLRFFGYKKTINVIHTNLVDYYSSVGFIKKTIIRFMMWSVKKDRVVFVSKEAELKAKEFFSLENTTTIYNIYTPAMTHAPKQKHDKLILGVLARLHQVKNIDLAIRLITKLKPKYPSLELHIYGKGDEEQRLRGYIEELGCGSFVFLKGFTSDQQAFFASIDALVSFSSLEGLPTVILESVGFKTPILYTDCSSGPRELMSASSDPMEKTKSFEKTDIGYLIKPLFSQYPYSKTLIGHELEYVEIVDSFIADLKSDDFSMEYDFERFSENNIVKEWTKYIL